MLTYIFLSDYNLLLHCQSLATNIPTYSPTYIYYFRQLLFFWFYLHTTFRTSFLPFCYVDRYVSITLDRTVTAYSPYTPLHINFSMVYIAIYLRTICLLQFFNISRYTKTTYRLESKDSVL